LQIERVLDWATAHKYRAGDNPAAMKVLKNLLPGQTGIVRHHPALPAAEIGTFVRDLRKQPGAAALALELTILTAARTGETIGATWGEIDLKEKLWTVPAARMKSPRDHRVPLSDRAVEILEEKRPVDPIANAFVFPGGKLGKPLSNMAMLAVLRRMGRSDISTHGFRSTFRDWAAESGFPREVAEAALAHVVGDRVEAAYLRTTLFDRRRKMMDAWGVVCSTTADKRTLNVVPLRSAQVAG
jgi:integrase